MFPYPITFQHHFFFVLSIFKIDIFWQIYLFFFFFVNRSSCGFRLAILCGIHKLGLLLSHWGSSWVFNGMGFPPRSYGTYYIVSLWFLLLGICFGMHISIVDWHLVIKWTRLGNLGRNDLWRDSSPNLDIGHYHHSMRLGKRGKRLWNFKSLLTFC